MNFGRKSLQLGAVLLFFCPLWLNAGVIWSEGMLGTGDAGSMPNTAQDTTLQMGVLDAITGNLSTANGVDFYRIFITQPETFGAAASARGRNQTLIPQLFLFDSNWFPVAGASGAFVGTADMLFGPTDPGIYYLAIDSVGRDPFFWHSVTRRNGTVVNQKAALFCPSGFDPLSLTPCDGLTDPGAPGIVTDNIPVDGFTGTGISSGKYIIEFSGGGINSPEPGTVVFLSGGLAVVVGLARRRARAKAAHPDRS